MSSRLRAVDGFNPKRPTVDVSLKSVASPKEAAFMHNSYVYGATLDQIIEEEIQESASIATGIRTTMRRTIRRRGVAVTQPINPPGAQPLGTTRPEPLRLRFPFGESKKRQSMDSGFRERAHAKPLYIPRHSFHYVPKLSSPNNDGARAPHYDLAKKSVQSAVDKAARIRRISIASLKRVCRARPTKIISAILPLDVEEEEMGAPLFKPWTIGDQSIATYRNPRKWFLFIKDRLGGMIV
ncbi:hypothetical protein HOY82DRAFT_669079 [Tuber indicum]|nr:hypothetical protein HOY82DRAFT_669079 [Tuber indicum]